MKTILRLYIMILKKQIELQDKKRAKLLMQIHEAKQK